MKYRNRRINELGTYVCSGLSNLDRVLSERDSLRLSWGLKGGGIGRGNVTEIYGDAGVGKSSLALRFIVESQRENVGSSERCCVYVDSDYSFSMDYAEMCGVDLENLCVLRGGDGVLDCVREMIESGVVDLVVIDSVVSLNVGSCDSEDCQRLNILNWVRDIGDLLVRNRCVLLLVNHAYNRVDYGGKPYVGTALDGLHTLCDTRLYLSNEGVCDGGCLSRVRCRVVKNRVGGSYRGCDLYLRYGFGFVDDESIGGRLSMRGLRRYSEMEGSDELRFAAEPSGEK